MPYEVVAGGDRLGGGAAVVQSKVDCYGAVTSGGVGERVGGSVIRGGIGSTIDPSIVVAMVLRIGTRSAVADGEVECDGAIASGGVGEGVSSRAVIGGICVAVNPGIAIAVVL